MQAKQAEIALLRREQEGRLRNWNPNSRSPYGAPEEFMQAKQAEIALLRREREGRLRNWNRREK